MKSLIYEHGKSSLVTERRAEYMSNTSWLSVVAGGSSFWSLCLLIKMGKISADIQNRKVGIEHLRKARMREREREEKERIKNLK